MNFSKPTLASSQAHSFEACFGRTLKALEEMKKGKIQEASKELLECIGILEVLISLEEDQDELLRLKDHISRLSSLQQSIQGE